MRQKMDYSHSESYFIYFLFLIPSTSSCIFFTIHNRMMPGYFITQNHTVVSFEGGCELICYKSPDKCKAANIVRQPDGTLCCQFGYLAISADNIEMLDYNPHGKYISLISEVTTGWPTINTAPSAACTYSTMFPNFPCTNALADNDLDWASLHEGAGAWIRIQFQQAQFVQRMEFQPRCVVSTATIGDLPKTAFVEFDDGPGHTGNVSPCIQGCSAVPVTNFPLSPSIWSTAVRVTVTETCDPNNIVNVGFKRIRIFTITP